MTVREVLHAHVPTLTAISTVRDAVDKLDIYQFPALVVVSEDGTPIGVLTEGDVCRAVIQRGDLIGIGHESAIAFASKQPTTISPGVEISDALHMMLSSGLTVLPVVDGSTFIGMVLRVDLMQAILMDAEAR